MKHATNFGRNLPLDRSPEPMRRIVFDIAAQRTPSTDPVALDSVIERVSSLSGIVAFAGGLMGTIYLAISIFS